MGFLTAAAIIGVGLQAKSYTDTRKDAKKQKQEIARQRGVAEDKRGSLIRQQRNQLGSSGGYSINSTGSTGLTQQGEETLG